MKTESFNLEKAGFQPMSSNELQITEGGGFFGDIAKILGVTAKCIWTFSKTASEFQHSLPANLKK